jgi:hypothetical protein
MLPDQLRARGPAERLWFVASNPNAATFAYERLLVCRAAAEMQMRRLLEASRNTRPSKPEPKPTDNPAHIAAYFAEAKQRLIPLTYEVHFYFVAWANCENMLRVLTGQPEFLEAKKVFDSYRKHFQHFTAARNTFEHYHDRLPGNADESRVREVIQGAGASPSRIYYDFCEGQYKHSDMSWDITSKGLELLCKAVDDTLTVLHDTIDRLFEAKFPPTSPPGVASVSDRGHR